MRKLINLFNNRSLLNKISNLQKSGFFAIVITDFFAKVISFLGNILLVRILTKNDYGFFSYTLNVLNVLSLIGDMGTSVVYLQLFSENYLDKEKCDGYFRHSFFRIIIYSVFSIVLILLSRFYYPYKLQNAYKYVAILSLIPLLNNIFSLLRMNLRANIQNFRFSLLNFLNIFFHYIFLISLSYKFYLHGALVAQYIYIIFSIIFGIILNNKLPNLFDNVSYKISRKEISDFFKLGTVSQINNSLCAALMMLDIFIIGILISDTSILASYKTATIIPTALAFISSSIMSYFIPFFSRNIKNIDYVVKLYYKVITLTISISLFILIILQFFANEFFTIVFGNQYFDSIKYFKILLISFLFNNAITIPTINVMYTQRKVFVNLFITVLQNILNIILDIILINTMGPLGASIATTTVSVFGAILVFLYFNMFIRSKK